MLPRFTTVASMYRSRTLSRLPRRLSQSITTLGITATYGAKRKFALPLISSSATVAIGIGEATRIEVWRKVMQLARRDFLTLCAAGSLAGLASHESRAEVYPSRPIKIIVPYAPGGPNDTIARLITSEAFRREGVSFMIDNIPGGAGNVGTAAAAR